MSFDSHSLERLRKLGRTLPKSIAKPNTTQEVGFPQKAKLHPIEIENDPQALFQELMKASPDGKVPPHLIDRLKKVEENKLSQDNNDLTKERSAPNKQGSNTSRRSQYHKGNEEDLLYTSFERLLLETEEEI